MYVDIVISNAFNLIFFFFQYKCVEILAAKACKISISAAINISVSSYWQPRPVKYACLGPSI